MTIIIYKQVKLNILFYNYFRVASGRHRRIPHNGKVLQDTPRVALYMDEFSITGASMAHHLEKFYQVMVRQVD